MTATAVIRKELEEIADELSELDDLEPLNHDDEKYRYQLLDEQRTLQ